MKDKQFPGKMDRTSERKYKTTYPMEHGKKLKHVKMFENFESGVNENNAPIDAVFYKWGKYSGEEKVTMQEIKQMVQLSDELDGFELRDEDADLVFYALDRDIDDTNVEDEGYGVKRAYGIKPLDEKGLWTNVHAKRKRGEKPAKPGDDDYPDAKAWKDAQNESLSSLPDGRLWAMFQSLKDQYESNRPMSDAEEKKMWELQGEIWSRRGGKFGLGTKVDTSKRTIK
jgi:hypothetical protein